MTFETRTAAAGRDDQTEPIKTSHARRVPRDGGRNPNPRRTIVFRLLALASPLLLLAIAEASLALFGAGNPDALQDPFVGFSAVHPLFVRADDRFQTADSRLDFFRRDSFAVEKSAGTRRIFCLGGSTVQGRPWDLDTAFPRCAEFGLEAATGSDWEVINCGGISYASYRLVPILEEVLQYEPDAIVVCTGHNEFLEDRSYGKLKQPSRIAQLALRLRTVNVARDMFRPADSATEKPDRPTLPADVEARLDFQAGLAQYHRDPEWHKNIAQHFGFNLNRMAELCRRAKVPLIFVRPPVDLRDTRPFKSQHGPLTPDEKTQWTSHVLSARKLVRSDLHATIQEWKRAVALDPLHAESVFELGKCLEAAGQFTEAKSVFQQALDQDVCPLRMTTTLRSVMEQVARNQAVPLVDAQQLLEDESRHGMTGRSMIVDHIHPTFRGHRIIANAIVTEICDALSLPEKTDWQTRAADVWKEKFQQLDDHYFLRGQRNLEALRGWSQGKADRVRGED